MGDSVWGIKCDEKIEYVKVNVGIGEWKIECTSEGQSQSTATLGITDAVSFLFLFEGKRKRFYKGKGQSVIRNLFNYNNF